MGAIGLDAMRAPRFTGIGTFMRLPNVVDMTGVDAALIGIPFDTAVSYRIGGRFGPAAIREASRLLRPYNVEQGVDIFELVSAVDAGDLSVIPGNVQATYAVVEEGLKSILDAGVSRSHLAETTRLPWESSGRPSSGTARSA